MLTFISIIALVFACVVSFFFLLALIGFIAEGDRRPAVVTLLVGMAVGGGSHAMWLLEYPGKSLVIGVVLALAGLTLVVLLSRWGKKEPLRITGQQQRIDERDAIFHRFYRLEKGTPEFEEFYATHPEKKEFDDKVRALPGLAVPGSRTWDPITSPFQVAAFSLTEELTREIEWKPSPIEDHPVEGTPEDFSLHIKGLALAAGAKLVGCTQLNPAYVYSHIGRSPGPWGEPITLDHTHAIAIAVEMSHEMVAQAPDSPTTTETAIKYLEAAKIAMLVTRYINTLGYEARAHVDGNYRVMCVPIAADAGLGELGRLGLLITPEFGPRIRLAVVTTDLPLAEDKPVTFGVQDFCSFCKKCAQRCPSGAVDKGDKEIYGGVEKWQTDQESCYRYWRLGGSDCALCVKVCPYSHENNILHNTIRWVIQRNPLSRRVALWAGDVLYGSQLKTGRLAPLWHRQEK